MRCSTGRRFRLRTTSRQRKPFSWSGYMLALAACISSSGSRAARALLRRHGLMNRLSIMLKSQARTSASLRRASSLSNAFGPGSRGPSRQHPRVNGVGRQHSGVAPECMPR